MLHRAHQKASVLQAVTEARAFRRIRVGRQHQIDSA
jgi:hypothetical protein